MTAAPRSGSGTGWVTTGTSVVSTAFSINKPTATVANDLLLLIIDTATTTGETLGTSLTGWTLLDTSPALPAADGSSSTNIVAYYKIAGGSEPSSYSGTFTNAAGHEAAIIAFSGADTANPFSPATGYSQKNAFGTSATVTNTGMSPAVVNGLYVTLWGSTAGGTMLSTLPAGTTKLLDATDNGGLSSVAVAVCYETLSASGAMGTRAFTFPSNIVSEVAAVIIQPPLPSIYPLPWRNPMIFTRL